ncbi:leucine-rich repeat protein 1 [Orussus abietinus]|uniref:leucine-rich repeat protein 1 n=1 Tax=Orussus abietinus TaxID=222816 RepID=UPI0006250E1F|nr:leucine-rich repeat protein 1 [Orussus abietinus]
MKLICNIEVSFRQAVTSNCISTRRKSRQACLTLGRYSVKNNELYILLQTQQDKQGIKYKIDNNIEKIFANFVNEGKATIRMKEPPHDLIIQSDTLQLKSFLHVLKLGISKSADLNVLNVSNLNPKNVLPGQRSKIIIRKASDYPVLQGFSKTTEELHVVGLKRKSFDRQILRLQCLRVLNLSDNQISALPKELDLLKNLQELNLANNLLGSAPLSRWAWLNGESMRHGLRLLDISSNNIATLPPQIGNLTALITLKAGDNALSYLPQAIGSMINLKYLDISGNKLLFLPGSLKHLRLNDLDISGNPFNPSETFSIVRMGVFSLVEIAARVVLKKRVPYTSSKIPLTLIKHLDEAQLCTCGNPCLNYYFRRVMNIELNGFTSSFKVSGNCSPKFDCYFCSLSCVQRYSKFSMLN